MASSRAPLLLVAAVAAVLTTVGACGDDGAGPGAPLDAGSDATATPDAAQVDASDAAHAVLPEPESLVWIGAHPDDEMYAAPWLGHLCLDKQASCTFLVLTRGEAGNCKLAGGCAPDLATVRDAELVASAELFGAKLVHWDLGDGSAGDPEGVLQSWAAKAGGEAKLVQDVQAVIAGAELIVTFDPRHGDSCHADHRAAAALAIVAATSNDSGPAPGVMMVASKQIVSPAVADPAIVAFDATRVLSATSQSAWSVLVSVLQTHASQFTPDEVAAAQNVPAELQKTHLLDLADAVADDPKYANVCP